MPPKASPTHCRHRTRAATFCVCAFPWFRGPTPPPASIAIRRWSFSCIRRIRASPMKRPRRRPLTQPTLEKPAQPDNGPRPEAGSRAWRERYSNRLGRRPPAGHRADARQKRRVRQRSTQPGQHHAVRARRIPQRGLAIGRRGEDGGGDIRLRRIGGGLLAHRPEAADHRTKLVHGVGRWGARQPTHARGRRSCLRA